MANPQEAAGFLDDAGAGAGIGVITGGVVRDPQSSTLASVIEGLWARQNLSTGVVLTRIADTAKTFTVSVETYVVVNSAGAIAYTEVALAAAKPSNATFEAAHGVGYELLAKVVTDGARILDGGVTDMRRHAGVDMQSAVFYQSFATTETGAQYWVAPCRARVWKFQTVAVDTLAGSDAGTVTAALGINDKYTNMTNGATSLAASSPTGTRASALPSASFIVQPGQCVRLTSAKTTSGGTANTQMLWSKW